MTVQISPLKKKVVSGFDLMRDELNVSGHHNGHNVCLWWGNTNELPEYFDPRAYCG